MDKKKESPLCGLSRKSYENLRNLKKTRRLLKKKIKNADPADTLFPRHS